MKWFLPILLVVVFMGGWFLVPHHLESLGVWDMYQYVHVWLVPFWSFAVGAVVFLTAGFLFGRAAYRRDH